jgi:hypothetical protein
MSFFLDCASQSGQIDPISKKPITEKRAGGMVQVVGHLPSKDEALIEFEALSSSHK